jgi:hypothetical protein
MSLFLNDKIFFIDIYIIQYKSSFIRIINKNTNEIFQSHIKYNLIPFISYRQKPFPLCEVSHEYFNYYNYYCNNTVELEETLEIVFNDIESIKIYEFPNYILLHFYSMSDYDFHINITKSI